MSSSSSSRCGISTLPNELVALIVRYAVRTPYGIEPSDLVPQEWLSVMSKRTETDHRENASKQWMVASVCKTWYTFATPFLYEWITFHRRHRHQKKHLDVLRSSPKWGTDVNTHNFGWYTKRLDIEFQDSKALRQEVWSNLINTIHTLPNLEVVTIKTTCSFHSLKMHSEVLSVMPQCLKVISWHDNRCLPEAQAWCAFLDSHPHLVAVNLPLRTWCWDPPSFPSAPSLEHNCIFDRPRKSMDELMGPFASLQRLTISKAYRRLAPEFIDAMMRYASTLRTIQFNLEELPDIVAARGLGPLFNASRHLHRLDLVIQSWYVGHLRNQWELPSSIRELGIRVVSVDKPSTDDIVLFFRFLAKLCRAKGRKPVRIEFLDDYNLNQVLVHSALLLEVSEDVVTSWLRPNGEMFDLKRLDNLEQSCQNAEKEILIEVEKAVLRKKYMYT